MFCGAARRCHKNVTTLVDTVFEYFGIFPVHGINTYIALLYTNVYDEHDPSVTDCR